MLCDRLLLVALLHAFEERLFPRAPSSSASTAPLADWSGVNGACRFVGAAPTTAFVWRTHWRWMAPHEATTREEPANHQSPSVYASGTCGSLGSSFVFRLLALALCFSLTTNRHVSLGRWGVECAIFSCILFRLPATTSAIAFGGPTAPLPPSVPRFRHRGCCPQWAMIRSSKSGRIWEKKIIRGVNNKKTQYPITRSSKCGRICGHGKPR